MTGKDDAPLPPLFTLLERARDVHPSYIRPRYNSHGSESALPALSHSVSSGSFSSQSSTTGSLPPILSLSSSSLPLTPPPSEREEWRHPIRLPPMAPSCTSAPSPFIRNPPSPVSSSSSSGSRIQLPPLVTSRQQPGSPPPAIGPTGPVNTGSRPAIPHTTSFTPSPIVHSPTALSPTSSAPIPVLGRLNSSVQDGSLAPSSPASATSSNPPGSWPVPARPGHHHHHHHLVTHPHIPAGFPQPTQDRYVCPTCSKSFSRPSSLRIHSHSHTGEKPFKCSHLGCGKAFSVRSNMKRHERGCHAAAAAAMADRRTPMPEHMAMPLRHGPVGPMHRAMPMSLPHQLPVPHGHQPHPHQPAAHPHSYSLHPSHVQV